MTDSNVVAVHGDWLVGPDRESVYEEGGVGA